MDQHQQFSVFSKLFPLKFSDASFILTSHYVVFSVLNVALSALEARALISGGPRRWFYVGQSVIPLIRGPS